MAGSVHVPWYATGFRADGFEPLLAEIAAVALRYGASEYEVFRSHDDRYRFLQTATFERKLDFERYWYGPEFAAFRADYSGWYQVPLAYGWHDVVGRGAIADEVVAGAGNAGERR